MTMRADFMAVMLALSIGAAQPAVSQPAAKPAMSFSYVASPARRKANFAAIVNEYRKTSPAAAAQLDTMLASTDVVALMQKGMAQWGLRTDDVADVYAVWWASQWLASRGRQDTPSRAQMTAIRAQSARAMAATPVFAKTDDAQKQEMADSFLFQTLLIEILMDQGKTNPEALRAAATMAGTNAKSLGLDLATIELTATGFDGAGQAAPRVATAIAARAPVAKRLPVPAAPASGPAGLIGMWRSDWVENQYRAFTGLALISMNNTLAFTRGGYFFDGVPEGAGFDDAGAQAIMRSKPNSAGRYAVQPGKIVLSYADGHTETVDAKRQGNSWTLNFKGKWMSPKLLFPDGATLSGLYTNENITNAGGGIFVVGDHDFSFAPDGRFARGSRVSMSAPAMSSRDGGTRDGGRYRIQNSALILDYADGRREVMSLFQETRGEAIWLNDTIYKPAR